MRSNLLKPEAVASADLNHIILMWVLFTTAEWHIDITTECAWSMWRQDTYLWDGSSYCRWQRWVFYSIPASWRQHLLFAPLMTINGQNDWELIVAITRARPLTLSGRFIRSCALDTHILALLFQRKNKGRLPASERDASHPESHVDADSVRSVSTLSWGEHFNSFSYFHRGYWAQLSTHSFSGYLTKV
jgi:hypothetical protein